MKKNNLATVLICAVFILLFILFLHPFEGTGDFYHHVNTGRYIVEQKALPNLDTFSHTAANQPWVAHSWLSGLIFYILLSNFSEISISLFTATVATFSLALLYILLRSYKIGKISSILAVIATATAFMTRFPQRPEIFAYPLTIGILLIDSLKNKYRKLIYLLPVLIIIWANIYGSSVLFGIGLVGLIGLKQFFSSKFKIKKEDISFYIICFVSIFASLINGYGIKTVFYFYLYIPKVSIYEGEWAGIQRLIASMPEGQLITSQYFILTYILFVLSFVITCAISHKILKKNIFFLVLSGFLVLPFFAFRTFPLAAILAAPLLAVSISYIIESKKLILLAPFLILTGICIYILLWINPPRITTYSNPTLSDMQSFINKNNLEGNALNLGHFGGYISYKFDPKIKVFFDTRDELYINSPAIADLYGTYNRNESVIPLLKKYNVDMVIADSLTDGMNYKDLFYSLEWAPIYLNDRYFIVIPTKVAKEKNIPILSFIDPFSKSAAKPGLEKEAKEYYKKLLNKNPDSLLNKFYLTQVLSKLGEFDEVIIIADSIKVNEASITGPSMKRDLSNLLAEAYMENEDCAQTKKYMDLAQKPIKKVMIFKQEANNGTFIPKALPFYYLICENDPVAGQYSLNEYFKQGVTPLEQLELTRKFEKESAQ